MLPVICSVISIRLAESSAVLWPWETAVFSPQPARRGIRSAKIIEKDLVMARTKMEDRGWWMEKRFVAIVHPPSSILVFYLPAHAHFVAHGNFRPAAFASDVSQAEGEVIIRRAAVDDVHHLALEREIRLDAIGGRRAGGAAD